MNQKGQIWMTKSLNERQRSYAQNVGLQIKEVALTKIHHIDFPKEIPEAEAWIFTSQNAVKNILRQAQYDKGNFSGTVYASGKQTAKALQEKGFETKSGADETALSLAETIAEDGIRSALFFCGNIRRNELPEYLAKKGVQLKEEVVYHTLLEPKMIHAQKGDALFFMSPSAVEAFAMINDFSTEIDYYSIGETTANALRKKGIQKSYTAAEASLEAMLKQYTTENK
jgi:uroporphyrinogen-III synthase